MLPPPLPQEPKEFYLMRVLGISKHFPTCCLPPELWVSGTHCEGSAEESAGDDTIGGGTPEVLEPRSTGLPKVYLASQLAKSLPFAFHKIMSSGLVYLGSTSGSLVDLGFRDFSGHGWY